MNLELLDPFGRQIPDRVDATLGCPVTSPDHPHHHTAATATAAPPSPAYHVAWNRRGTYLATGYANGTVAVHSLLSRSVVSVYPPPPPPPTTAAATPTDRRGKPKQSSSASTTTTGITSVSWARRSRTLLAGAAGDSVVQILDLTHPHGPEGASLLSTSAQHHGGGGAGKSNNDDDQQQQQQHGKGVDGDGDDDASSPTKTEQKKSPSPFRGDGSVVSPLHTLTQTQDTAFVDTEDPRVQLVTERHVLRVRHVVTTANPRSQQRRAGHKVKMTATKTKTTTTPRRRRPKRGKRYPALAWSFGDNDHHDKQKALVGGSLQIHPTVEHAGLATLQDGRLMVFYTSPDAWYRNIKSYNSTNSNNNSNDSPKKYSTRKSKEGEDTEPPSPPQQQQTDDDEDDEQEEDKVHVLTLTTSESYDIASAAFSPTGEEILAITKDGYILGWNKLDETTFWKALAEKAPAIDTNPAVVTTIPTKPTLWQLLISHNGKHFAVNAADGILRLYRTADFWDRGSNVEPTNQFQDVVNKVKFSSCDFSGDGEYLVGGVNGNDNRYELYIWSTATGLLVDTLRGVSVQLYAVAWHPTRALLAAATADGLVDLWGARINWTAFAPDFQALPRNVEYVEREDEFDQTENGTYLTSKTDGGTADGRGDSADPLDVRTIVPVPAFASDSEDETDVFNFEPRVGGASGKQTSRFRSPDKNNPDD